MSAIVPYGSNPNGGAIVPFGECIGKMDDFKLLTSQDVSGLLTKGVNNIEERYKVMSQVNPQVRALADFIESTSASTQQLLQQQHTEIGHAFNNVHNHMNQNQANTDAKLEHIWMLLQALQPQPQQQLQVPQPQQLQAWHPQPTAQPMSLVQLAKQAINQKVNPVDIMALYRAALIFFDVPPNTCVPIYDETTLPRSRGDKIIPPEWNCAVYSYPQPNSKLLVPIVYLVEAGANVEDQKEKVVRYLVDNAPRGTRFYRKD